MHATRTLHRSAAALLLAGTLALAACGGDDSSDPTATSASTAAPASTTPATTSAPADPAIEPVELVASDYAFGGLPPTVPAGTPFVVTNTSATELHEFVLLRLADDDDRPIDDIVHHDLEATLTSGPPALVILAPPAGAEQIVAVGDGTLQEPGRYLAICMIPTGADPAAYLEAAANSGGAPPSVPGGPPHAMQGMYAEVTVA